MARSGFISNTVYSLGGFAVMTLSNFVFNALAARFLGPSDYSVYNSFFYLLLAFAQPNNSLQLAVAKYTSDESVTVKTALKDITPTVIIFACALFIIFIAASPFLKMVYNLKRISDVYIGGGVVAIWLLIAGYRGVYQGKLDFMTYGLNVGVESLIRAVLGIALILLGLGTRGAIGVSILSCLVGIVILIEGKWSFLAHHIHLSNWRVNKKIAREFIKACAVLIPFGIMTSLDLGLIQFLEPGKQSGFVSGCALFGKSLIMLSLVFANVVYSYILKHQEKVLWVGILISLTTFILAFVFSLLLGDKMIVLVLGSDYLPAVELLPVYILASLPLGIMQILVNYSIARDMKTIRFLLWIFLAVLGAVYYFALKALPIKDFIFVMMGVLAFMDVILLIIIGRFIRLNKNIC